MSDKQPTDPFEIIAKAHAEAQQAETSYAIHGCIRWVALIVILIAAIVLGTPAP
jgi:hypothetical protein